jgi:hypothetical protein
MLSMKARDQAKKSKRKSSPIFMVHSLFERIMHLKFSNPKPEA